MCVSLLETTLKWTGSPFGSACLTLTGAALTVIDTTNIITQTAINPLYFIVCTVVAAIFVSMTHLYRNTKEWDQEDGVNEGHVLSSLFSFVAGVIPGLATIERTNVLARFFFGSSVAGFRFGGMAAHAFWHAKYVRKTWD